MASGTFVRGDPITLSFNTYDATTSPPSLVNVDSATISLYRPSGDAAVSGAAMTNSATGTYSYSFQTVSSDETGVWTAVATATKTGLTKTTPPQEVFSLT